MFLKAERAAVSHESAARSNGALRQNSNRATNCPVRGAGYALFWLFESIALKLTKPKPPVRTPWPFRVAAVCGFEVRDRGEKRGG